MSFDFFEFTPSSLVPLHNTLPRQRHKPRPFCKPPSRDDRSRTFGAVE